MRDTGRCARRVCSLKCKNNCKVIVVVMAKNANHTALVYYVQTYNTTTLLVAEKLCRWDWAGKEDRDQTGRQRTNERRSGNNINLCLQALSNTKEREWNTEVGSYRISSQINTHFTFCEYVPVVLTKQRTFAPELTFSFFSFHYQQCFLAFWLWAKRERSRRHDNTFGTWWDVTNYSGRDCHLHPARSSRPRPVCQTTTPGL